MSTNFINLKGESYFIKKKLTKKGNTTYYMTKKQDGECLDTMPAGYEVFEKYDSGMMFIRRTKARLFRDTEIKLIENELKKNKTVLDFKLDVNGELIKIYTVENDPFSDFPQKGNSGDLLKNMLMSHLMTRFAERMRIKIEEEGERNFVFERYCYRGRIDDWIFIDYGDDLEILAKENLIHLGKESYYNLM